MESYTWLIQYVERSHQAASQGRYQVDTLTLPSRQGVLAAVECEITKTHIQKELQPVADLCEQPFRDDGIGFVQL